MEIHNGAFEANTIGIPLFKIIDPELASSAHAKPFDDFGQEPKEVGVAVDGSKSAHTRALRKSSLHTARMINLDSLIVDADFLINTMPRGRRFIDLLPLFKDPIGVRQLYWKRVTDRSAHFQILLNLDTSRESIFRYSIQCQASSSSAASQGLLSSFDHAQKFCQNPSATGRLPAFHRRKKCYEARQGVIDSRLQIRRVRSCPSQVV